MSLTIPFASRGEKPRRKHRADDRIAELRQQHEQQVGELRDENVRLHHFKAQADDFFMVQAAYLTGLEEDVRRLKAQLVDEQGARAVAEKDVETRGRWIADLESKVAELERRLDIRSLAEAAAARTQEIPVVPVPLHQAPFATTNPGRGTPSWASVDEPAAT